MKEKTFDEYKNLIDQLEPKARRDVFAVSTFLLWKQKHKPAPLQIILLGAWLFISWKAINIFKRLKLKIFIVLIPLLVLACSLTAQAPQSSITARRDATPAQLSQLTTPGSPVCIVKAFEALNLREGPGIDAAVIAVLAHGDQLTILSDPAQGLWIHVQTLNRTGWINSNYCEGEK